MFKRTKRTPETFSRVIRWAVIAFVVYALFSSRFHFALQDKSVAVKQQEQHEAGTVAVKVTGPKVTDCDNQGGLDNFSVLATSLIPTAIPAVRVSQIKPGVGALGAVCGQTATLHFEYALENGKVIYSDMDGKPAKVTLGDGRLLRGLELGIMNMKPGAERKAIFSPGLGYGRVKDNSGLIGWDKAAPLARQLESAIIVAKYTLDTLAPPIPSTALQLRVIDHSIGGGGRAQCGDRVSADMTVWRLDGTKLFSTTDNRKPISFTLGASEVPFGIEQSVLNMSERSQRTVILPPAFNKPLSKPDSEGKVDGVSLPDETLLVEVRLLDIGQAPSAKPKVQKTPATKVKEDDDSDQDDSH